MDEYDNIDCEFLLEFLVDVPGGTVQQGCDSTINQKQNSTFPSSISGENSYSGSGVGVGSASVPTIVQKPISMLEQIALRSAELKLQEQERNLEDERNGKNATGPRAKRPRLMSNETGEGNPNPPSHIKGENVTIGKTPAAKSAISKSVQLEASKDRRRFVKF